MRTIRLTLQYDGTDYHGWQVQPNGLTVQEVLQRRITAMTGETVVVHGAGRTDAGVHALGQVASFVTGSSLDVVTIMRALNSLLPRDIRITEASVAPEGFHPRFSAKAKRYFYLIVNSASVSPFVDRYSWRVPYSLHIGTMREAAHSLKGSHDFSSFKASGCDAKTANRTISSIEIETGETGYMNSTAQDKMIKVTIEADGFMRYMARNIVGTLVEIGRGNIKKESLGGIMLSRDRNRAGPTAPARGLFLERVMF